MTQNQPDNTGLVVPEQTDALVKATSQREIAEVQAAMLVAQRFPRDEVAARERILISCQRPGLAEGAMYTYARGGSNITGPSIRLAEAIAQAWGNLQFGIRELEQKDGASTVEAYAWDMERNTRQVMVFRVPHKRHTKQGAYALDDPRDIYEMVANQGARRRRACILALIPGDIIEDAVKQCEETLKAKADLSPASLKQMLDAFEKFGVTKEQIEHRLQRKLEAITPAQKIGLGKIYNSLKDGMGVAADYFETEPTGDTPTPAKGNEGLKETLRKKAAAPAKEAPADAPADPPSLTERVERRKELIGKLVTAGKLDPKKLPAVPTDPEDAEGYLEQTAKLIEGAEEQAG